jgi:hypothetical protein
MEVKKEVKPRTAKPATPSPITVPPPKETFKACGKLVRAACVVLTFVLLLFHSHIPSQSGEKGTENKQLLLICVVGTK